MANDTANTQSLGQFGDSLDAHARRCWGLSAAISGFARYGGSTSDPMLDGVEQLVQDICQEAEKLSKDMAAMWDTEEAMQDMIEQLQRAIRFKQERSDNQ